MNIIKRITLSGLACLILLCSCQKEPHLALSSAKLEFDHTAQKVTIDVQSNLRWQATLTQPWLTVQPASGEGNGRLKLSIPEWDGDEDRSAILTVKSGELIRTVAICQKAVHCGLSESQIELMYTGASGKVLLSSSVPWRVEVPDDATWLQVSPSSGSAAQAIELTCQAQPNEGDVRQTEVNIRCGIRTLVLTVIQQPLTVPQYTYTVLQEHTQGIYPNEVIIMGDGYTAADYRENGPFDRDAQEAMEALFSIEPFTTYRSYFRVAKFVVYSPERGITERDKQIQVNTAFNVYFEESSIVSLKNPNLVFHTLVGHIPDMTSERLSNTLVILMANIDRYGGVCWLYGDGSALALCPVSRSSSYGYTKFADLVRHEAGGHGFGRLLDEYVIHTGQTLPDEATSESPYRHKEELRQRQYYGYGANIDISGHRDSASWAHFYMLPGYEAVGYYEGAYFYEKGAWRPELCSCMADNRPYYNAPSRESIVKILLRRAAGVRLCDYEYQSDSETFELVPIPNDPFNMEDFIRNDTKKSWSAPMLAPPVDTRANHFFVPTAPVRFIPGSPFD